MNVTIRSPEHQNFIDEQIRSGRFSSAEELVANAIADLIANGRDDEEFDDATAAKLNAAYDRGVRGQSGYTMEQAREKLLGKPQT